MTSEERTVEIERVRRIIGGGISEVREEDRGFKRDMPSLERYLKTLLEDQAAVAVSQFSRIRQTRIIGGKGL